MRWDNSCRHKSLSPSQRPKQQTSSWWLKLEPVWRGLPRCGSRTGTEGLTGCERRRQQGERPEPWAGRRSEERWGDSQTPAESSPQNWTLISCHNRWHVGRRTEMWTVRMKIFYPWCELLGEGLPEGRGEVVVLWTVVDLVWGPKDGHLWRRQHTHAHNEILISCEVITAVTCALMRYSAHSGHVTFTTLLHWPWTFTHIRRPLQKPQKVIYLGNQPRSFPRWVTGHARPQKESFRSCS